MAARWSPKPLVRVRVSGGVPKFRFAVICLIGYNYSLNGEDVLMVGQRIVNPWPHEASGFDPLLLHQIYATVVEWYTQQT